MIFFQEFHRIIESMIFYRKLSIIESFLDLYIEKISDLMSQYFPRFLYGKIHYFNDSMVPDFF